MQQITSRATESWQLQRRATGRDVIYCASCAQRDLGRDGDTWIVSRSTVTYSGSESTYNSSLVRPYWISSPTCDTCAHTVSAQIPMSLQTVNQDVIAIVLSYLEPKQALPLATTCRSLHVPATQRLLSEYSATFSDSGNDDGTDRLLKFCEYMLACPQRRLPCLKVLVIETWALIPPSLALTGVAGVV